MAPKRKPPQKTKLEDVTGSTPVTKKSKAGHLDQVTIEKQDESRAELFKKRHAKKSGTKDLASAAMEQSAKAKPADNSSQDEGNQGSSDAGIWVNRAPVLTLWVAVVAQRQGFSRNAGLTFGKAIAGMLAQSKGKSIGVIQDSKKDETEQQDKEAKEDEAGVQTVEVFGMKVKGIKSGDEVFAIDKGTNALKSVPIQAYLSRAFSSRLPDAEHGLKQLAESFSAEEIGGEAYRLYERFRPNVPQGQQGWGKKGLLELDRLAELHA